MTRASHFNHLKRLVAALFEIERPVSASRLDVLELELHEVHTEALRLYGVNFYTQKWHFLLHVIDLVRNYGPLSRQHCFGFEVHASAQFCFCFHVCLFS